MGRRRSRSRSDSYNSDDSRRNSESRHGRDESKEYWRAVESDPHNFDAWTRLLQFVEQNGEVKIAEEAFDAFLKRYPFCYGYWRKYAVLLERNQQYEKALNVYERGVKSIPLSVDLWLGYIGFIKEIGAGQKQATAKTRAVYMRALDSCGLDFRSDKLWTQYIEYEISVGDYMRASQVYDILLGTPTMNYVEHFERYKQFVASYEPDQILNQQEYDSIYDKVYDQVRNDLDGGPAFYLEEYEEDIPDDEQMDDGVTKRAVSRRKHVDVALNEFRREIISRRTKLHKSNDAAVGARLNFESGIKRPYFHVKPLEREQLLNWHNYLDFEISENKKKRIQILFMRAVISCALYEEIWIKYAAYYDSIEETDKARDIYKQASEIHCSRKPGIHLAFSAFEEKHGKSTGRAFCLNVRSSSLPKTQNLKTRSHNTYLFCDNCELFLKVKKNFTFLLLLFDMKKCGDSDSSLALNILKEFDRRYSGFVAISMRKMHIERRLQAKEKNPDYSQIISKLERLMNEPGNSRRVSSFYALKLARLHSKICHDRRQARQVIKDAILRDRDNLQLYMTLIDIAFSSSHFRESEVLDAFDYALESKHLSNEQRFLFSQRKLDFLEEMSNDPAQLQQHYVNHIKLEKQLEEPAPTLFSNLKRKPTAPAGDEPEAKRNYVGAHPNNGMYQQQAQYSASPVVWNMTPDMNQPQTMMQYM
ncbi:hypothetical protein M3Y97_00066500 [Aphelenchoides bicaudatus]|nr:hypothetical protein M3Y97_00066500 [Aphelenchoides bicaudatus]